MDDPGISLFQVNNINLNDQQNEEEAEDLEEQQKRREELQNLIANNLNDFEFENSTVDSSSNLCISIDGMDHEDKETNDQLMYDVQAREIERLKKKHETHKQMTAEEIDRLKRKLTLAEAEAHQVNISLRSTQSLLEEKIDEINLLNKQINTKNEQINKLEGTVEELRYDIQAYSNQLKEFQIKSHMNNGPFNLITAQADSEELKRAHNEEVERLQHLLSEHQKKSEYLYDEVETLKKDLQNTLHTKNENEIINNNLISSLTQNCQSAQDQCKELLNVLEIVSKENEHYRNRMQQLESSVLSTSYKNSNLDNETLQNHNERLKQMLVDKDVELNTLKCKVKFYDFDMSELIEYREIKNRALLITECNNSKHTTALLVFQEQILNLNNDLQVKNEKIADLMREIKHLEQKLEILNMVSLKEDKIQENNKIDLLEGKLSESETKNFNLNTKIKELEDKIIELKEENKQLNKFEQKYLENLNVIEMLKKTIDNNKLDVDENKNLKSENEKLNLLVSSLKLQSQESENLKLQLDILKKEYISLTKKLLPRDLHDDNDIIKDLIVLNTEIEEFLNDLSTKNIQNEIIKIKMITWSNLVQVSCKEVQKIIEQNIKYQNELESLNLSLSKSKEEQSKLNGLLNETNSAKTLLEEEKATLESELKRLQEEFNNAKSKIKSMLQESKHNLNENTSNSSYLIDIVKTELLKCHEELNTKNNVINQCDKKVEYLQNEINILNNKVDKYEQQIADLEIKNSNNILPESIGDCLGKNDYKSSEIEKEILIRDKLQKEYEHKISKIENQYKTILEKSTSKLKEMEKQDIFYKHQLSSILSKYAELIVPVQEENANLRKQLETCKSDFEEFKKYFYRFQNEYSTTIEKNQKEAHKSIDAWKLWAKKFVEGCLHIEKINAQSRESILNEINQMEQNVSSIEKYFDQKIKQYQKKHNLKS